VGLRRFLHLKTGVSYLGGDELLVAGELVAKVKLDGFDKTVMTPDEEYYADCVRVNDRVFVAAGCEQTKGKIIERG
jgi:dimethylargininase